MQNPYSPMFLVTFLMKRDGQEQLRLGAERLTFVPPIGATLSNLRPDERSFTVTEVDIDFAPALGFLEATVWVK